MAELLVVRSKLKECTKCNVAGDVAQTLSDRVRSMMKEAEARAKANGRKTIKSQDI